MPLNEQDIFIIKQNQSWASRSISKLRSLGDRTYGSSLRDILDKSVVVRTQTRNIWDDLASGETLLDNKALNNFIGLRTVFRGIRATIMNLAVPQLIKDKVDIAGAFSEEKEKPAKTKKPEQSSSISEAEKEYGLKHTRELMSNVGSAPIDETFQNEQVKVLQELTANEQLLMNETDKIKFNEILNKIINIYKLYEKQLKEHMAKNINTEEKSAHIYYELIKNANTLEQSSYYYMVALGKYGLIKTPLKELARNVRQYIPFAGEPADIHSYRKAAIAATKELAAFSKEFIITIQNAIKIPDKLEKWKLIITKYNEFADLYNSKIEFFSSMYDALTLKTKYDKMLKSKRKPKNTDKDLELSDFSEYDWRDISGGSSHKFKPIEKIGF